MKVVRVRLLPTHFQFVPTMDAKQVKALPSESKSCLKEFIKILVSKYSREISEIRNENFELKKSLEFSKNQLSDLTNQVALQDNDICNLLNIIIILTILFSPQKLIGNLFD